MADTGSHRSVTQRTHRAHRQHQLLLVLAGAGCVVFGILVAVVVPDTEGPAWAMAVAGCLAAGLLMLGRVALARFRPGRGAAL
ncbi:hypothetical protein AB0K43_18880 [Kitasatospora sp. NPDC049258]|uniref:hypothetical protein n=1 Tax=Kitasatospora sp. NPDC049258 TaxID=3155394 RepID=UPI00342D83AA